MEATESVRLGRDARVVETLYRLVEAVARERDLHEVVQFVTDEATAITGAQFGALFYDRVDRNGESYTLYAISGVPRSRFERFPMPRKTDIFRPTFEGTEIVRIDDVTVDPRYGRNPPYHGMPAGHLPVRSHLAVPVFAADDTVAGGLFLGHEQVGVFSAEHEQIAVAIARHAGLAISRARLLDAERAAREEAEALAAASLSLDHVGDGVVMTDAYGFVRLWNDAAARITGVAAGEATGRPLGDALPGWERIVLEVPVGAREDASRPRTLPLDCPAGEIWLSIYGVDFGEGLVYAFRDVTGERRFDELRSDLIATVSHEIRTPVAAVYGAARTLLRDGLDDDVHRRLLRILAEESERLARLVDEILLAGSIDSNRLAISRVEIDLVDVVHRAAASASVAGAEPLLELDLPAGPARVVADPERVGQVLANLLENAVKYGTGGASETIAVRVRELPATVRVEVADRGPGIPAAERERVFEKFHRLDPRLQSGVRGTGLGLYICRELVGRMQGTMGVESVEDEGSTFWFELPRPWA
jgi:signal transduction histidine kinase